jgi:hypothetical protein
MNDSRSYRRWNPRPLSRLSMGSYPQWAQVPELGTVREFTTSGQNKIFAIVSRPIPSGVEGKTIRRILIFDNHPDSLRLALESSVDSDSDDDECLRARRTSIVCGSILMAMLVVALVWPLFW